MSESTSLADYFRQQAKHLLRDLQSSDAVRRAGGTYRIERVRGAGSAAAVRLGDCQDVIAAELGVTPGDGGWRAFVARIGDAGLVLVPDEGMPGGRVAADEQPLLAVQTLDLLFLLFTVAKRHGVMELEKHVEKPQTSRLFAACPAVLASPLLLSFVTDAIKVLLTGVIKPERLERMLADDLDAGGWPPAERQIAHAAGRGLVALVADDSPLMAVEHARRALPLGARPSLDSLEERCRWLHELLDGLRGGERIEQLRREVLPPGGLPKPGLEGLAWFDPQYLQRVAKMVHPHVLSLAFGHVTGLVTEAFRRALPARTWQTIEENAIGRGPLRTRDVNAAQEKLLSVILDLDRRGEIALPEGWSPDRGIAGDGSEC